MLNRVIFLLIFNLKGIIKDYKKMILIFLVPLLTIAVSAVMLNNTNRIDSPSEKINLGIVDLEKTALSQMLIGTITEEDTLSNLMSFQVFEMEQADQALKAGHILSFIVIPENFSTGLLQMENPPLTIYNNGFTTFESFIVQRTIESFSSYVNYVEIATASEYQALRDIGYSRDKALKINDAVSFKLIMDTLGRKTIFKTTPIYNFPSVSSFIYHGVAIIVLILFFLTTLCAEDMIKDIDHQIIDRIKLSGTTTTALCLAKSTAYSLITTLWLALIIGTYMILTSQPSKVVLLLATFFAVSLMLNGFWLLIGMLIKHRDSFLSFSSLATVVIAFLGGSFFPVMLLPYEISRFTQFIPNVVITKNLIQLINGTYDLQQQILFILANLLLGLISLTAATALIRRNA
ncbi:MAG: ABC transporter permease [Tissierellales bacterium]|nr:ABC transporter permease [Tissierellales bacterium]